MHCAWILAVVTYIRYKVFHSSREERDRGIASGYGQFYSDTRGNTKLESLFTFLQQDYKWPAVCSCLYNNIHVSIKVRHYNRGSENQYFYSSGRFQIRPSPFKYGSLWHTAISFHYFFHILSSREFVHYWIVSWRIENGESPARSREGDFERRKN